MAMDRSTSSLVSRASKDKEILRGILQTIRNYWTSEYGYDLISNREYQWTLLVLKILEDNFQRLPDTLEGCAEALIRLSTELLDRMKAEIRADGEMEIDKAILLVVDMAKIFHSEGDLLRNVGPLLKTQSIANVAWTTGSEKNTVEVLVITTNEENGTIFPISPSSQLRTAPSLTFEDVADFDDEEWEKTIKRYPRQWRGAFAEALHVELTKSANSPSYKRRCYLRLRNLVGRYGVLPLCYHLSGTKISQVPFSRGVFADVYQGELGMAEVRVKVLRVANAYNRSEETFKTLAREVLLWKQFSHPNIVSLYGIDLLIQHPSYCLISPWMKQGNIISFLEARPDFDRLSLMRDVLSGLRYLHAIDPPISHGNIRGTNILITDDLHACLSDCGLGLAAEMYDLCPEMNQEVEAIRWRAPELLDLSKNVLEMDRRKSDIYAFGCTILEVYTGQPPFTKIQPNEVLHHVLEKKEKPPLPPDSELPMQLKLFRTLLKQLWAYEPDRRPEASGIDLDHVTIERRRSINSRIGGAGMKLLSVIGGAVVSGGGGATGMASGLPVQQVVPIKRGGVGGSTTVLSHPEVDYLKADAMSFVTTRTRSSSVTTNND